MHKKTYQLREMINLGKFKDGSGSMILPGKVFPRYFGCEDNADAYGSANFDSHKVTPVCFCELYRKDLASRWDQRPFTERKDLKRFIKRMVSASYRYLEASLTDSLGYKVYKRNWMEKYFPAHHMWPNQ